MNGKAATDLSQAGREVTSHWCKPDSEFDMLFPYSRRVTRGCRKLQRMDRVLGGVLIVFILIVTPVWPALAQNSEREAVLALVQGFFDGMAAKDVATLSEHLLDRGQFVSVREEANVPDLRVSSHRNWLAQLPAGETRVLERFWEPTVLIDGRIAVVWTRYDLYVDDVFSHCGTDVFNFIKSETGWLITGITYTVERDECEPSPLGPPVVP